MRDPVTAGGHLRIRPFNIDAYPEQRPGNDLCQAVVAGQTVYLQGQLAQDAESAPWPDTDLRVDCHDDPVGELTGLRRLSQRQAETCIRQAPRLAGAAG
jgi:hypothetical protein